MPRGGWIILPAALLLAGCHAWQPQPLEITDPAKYDADLSFCMAAAASYKPTFNLGSVGYGALSGGAQNAAGAAVSPFVPVLGAAGGATSALSSGIDLMGSARDNVAKHCLLERLHRDGAAIVADPD